MMIGMMFVKEKVSNGKDNYNAAWVVLVWLSFYLASIIVGMASPNLRVMTEGKLSVAQAKAVINWKPLIPSDDKYSEFLNVQGEI